MIHRNFFFRIWYFFLKKVMKFTIIHHDMKRLDYLPKEDSFIERDEETWGHFIDIDI